MNHSKGFKDPITGAHTNTVEGMWAQAKRGIPPSARRKKLFAGYMGSYMLRRKLWGERKSDSLLSFGKIANNYWSRSEQGEPEFSVLLEEEQENIVPVPSPIRIRIRIANGPNREKTYRLLGREPFVPRRSMRLRWAAINNE